jgi:NADH-quinone oxidoreductase subunit M
MIFFGAFSAGAPSKFGLNEFQIATVVALWGVVISTIFMLRSYRRIIMGPIGDKWKALPDIATVPRLCVTGLLVLLLIAGFFPQAVLNYVVPALMWP